MVKSEGSARPNQYFSFGPDAVPERTTYLACDRHLPRIPSGVVSYEPPVPMLSQLASRVPTGAQWLYEPKFDGFRGLLCRSSDGLVRLTSRQGKDLTDWFPELAQAGKCLPRSTVLDGEIVIADAEGRADLWRSSAKAGRSFAAQPANRGQLPGDSSGLRHARVCRHKPQAAATRRTAPSPGGRAPRPASMLAVDPADVGPES